MSSCRLSPNLRLAATCPLTWCCPHGVAGAHDDDLVGGDDQADAVGDVQRLAAGVVVPGCACPGGEAHGVDPDA